MHLGRVVFLAGLAPLLGWAAGVSAQPETARQAAAMEAPNSLASLLRTIVVLAADSRAETSGVREHRPQVQWVFELAALTQSPLGRSLWMVTGPSRGELPVRPPLILQLRC